ncbi:60S ribosomal protein L8-like [Iris pallida]|uniref:60S ribosomal protein L8-like n=1 Tax=Iris pallida TaxID=29817 RepID=A0AAX6H9I3_IRIPA|nr:60S ribosomal protein L8-like [Iris pallida]
MRPTSWLGTCSCSGRFLKERWCATSCITLGTKVFSLGPLGITRSSSSIIPTTGPQGQFLIDHHQDRSCICN